MSQPDDRPPEEPTGSSDIEPKLDEDAVWAEIVANYGDRLEMGSPTFDTEERVVEPVETTRPRNIFDRTYLESTTESPAEASWDDEGHFIPPTPPPLPTLEPRRKLAWIGMFGAPAVMLLAVVFGWQLSGWVGTLLVASFVSGFVYLVATMPRRPGDWSGDDGAVV